MINSASTTNYSIDLTTTRRDLAIGFIFSLCCLIATIWISEVLRSGPPKLVPKYVIPSVQIVLPKIEPDQQEVYDTQQQTAPADIAPPMLTDVPQVVAVNDFTLKPESPPQEGIAIDRQAITVPKGIGADKGQQIFNPSMLDQQPVATYQPSPVFPYDMKKTGVTGTVVVDFILEADGHVSSAYATSATQHEFEANAIQAVIKWKFHPGRRGGRPVRTHMSVPIKFMIEDQ